MNIKISDFFVNSQELEKVTIYNFSESLNMFIFGEERLGVKLLGIYFLISLIFYFLFNPSNRKFSLKKIWEFVFPRKIYSHPSSKMDFLIFFARSVFNPVKLLTFWVILFALAKKISQTLTTFFPPPWDRIEPNGFNLFLVSLGGFLLFDFIQYILHRIFHKTPFMWPFHAPHHSAEVLNPFTVQREHFVWEIVENLLVFSLFGIGQGIIIWVSFGSIKPEQIFNYTLIFNLFNYILGNFHHSHFWVSFGFFDRIFVSPAMHQLHHSVDPKHRNKNYGYFLSIWDQIFGTIYVPKEKEYLVYGIEKGVKNPHDTLLKFYFLPFKESWNIIKNKFQKLGLIKKPNTSSLTLKGAQTNVSKKAYKKNKVGSFQQSYKSK